jgi:hypothetical protein
MARQDPLIGFVAPLKRKLAASLVICRCLSTLAAHFLLIASIGGQTTPQSLLT